MKSCLTRHPLRPRAMAQRGSTLMLMPAAALVVIILASLAIDSAAVYMSKRELANAADAAANDAAAYGIDADHLRATGEIRLDGARVARIVSASLAAQNLRLAAEPVVEIVDARRVRVDLYRQVDHVIVRGRPSVEVRVSATALAHDPLLDPP